jgi:hypothetical protein
MIDGHYGPVGWMGERSRRMRCKSRSRLDYNRYAYERPGPSFSLSRLTPSTGACPDLDSN